MRKAVHTLFLTVVILLVLDAWDIASGEKE